MPATPEAPWRRRFRAARVSLPGWARDAPERLLYASNAGGKWELYAWDRAADSHRQITDRPEGTVGGGLTPAGDEIWWFDDDRGNEFGRWVAEPFAGGERREIAPDLPPAFRAGLALGSDGLAVLGCSTDAGSTIHLVRSGEPSRLLYEHSGSAHVAGLSRDGSLVCISHSEHGDSLHPALRILDLTGQPVANLWDGPAHGLDAGGWSPVPGDQRLLVTHERGDLHRPLIWSPLTGEAHELTFELPGEIAADWFPDAAALLVAHEYRGRSQLFRYALTTGELAPIVTPPGTIAGAEVRPDGEVWYAWSSAAEPLQIRTTADAGVLLRAPGEPPPGGVAYADAEAGEVPVLYALPPGDGPYPTLFEVHGGPIWHDQDSFSPFVQAWVDHGYAVVLVNYRGSTGYGKAWQDAIIGRPGLTELADIAAARDWAVASGLADPTRIVLSGGSWGGYLTLLGAGTQPERWSLGIAAVPVADYLAAFEDEMEQLKAFDRDLFGGSPDELPDEYRQRSPLTYVERVEVPLFILAGENDPRCPIRQVENYLARLAALGKPFEVYRFDAGHGSLVVEETIHQLELQLAFAARWLGTQPPL